MTELERAVARISAACPPGVGLLVYGETPMRRSVVSGGGGLAGERHAWEDVVRFEAVVRRDAPCAGCGDYAAQWDLPASYVEERGADACRAVFAEMVERQVRARYPF